MATLHVHQGVTKYVSFTWMSNAPTPTPLPLAGYAARFRLLKRAGGAVLLEVTPTSAADVGTITQEPSGETGEILVRIPANQTALLARDCVFEADLVDVTDPTREVVLLVSGPVVVTKQGG